MDCWGRVHEMIDRKDVEKTSKESRKVLSFFFSHLALQMFPCYLFQDSRSPRVL